MEVQTLLKMLRLDGSRKRIADAGQPSDIGLKTLPTELVIKIATALHPIDRASLAFTSSWLHRIIGNALKLNQFDRAEFLRRLELDGMWLSEIFCEACQKFHEPRVSREFTPREARRACVKYGDPKLEEKSFPPFLEDINFDIVAALSRFSRFRHKFTAESDFAAQWARLEDIVSVHTLTGLASTLASSAQITSSSGAEASGHFVRGQYRISTSQAEPCSNAHGLIKRIAGSIVKQGQDWTAA
ncbi:hypothetical protein FPANT_4009 [Fusarium pseudoanthophilum]|uniref:F-box domain-containing protein n=1 Tax=Fusarium pseudoanthophilum TaxID=48495 RepID=A0A8H5UTK1_9HYPO|nr:hypothetical protein FPANT_4009 [Fusarium pseudoanthophilum]